MAASKRVGVGKDTRTASTGLRDAPPVLLGDDDVALGWGGRCSCELTCRRCDWVGDGLTSKNTGTWFAFQKKREERSE